MTTAKVGFIHSQDVHAYSFNSDHPFHPIRYELTISLLEAINSLTPEQIITPRKRTEEQLEALVQLGHRLDYIDIVKKLSVTKPKEHDTSSADQYGFHDDETPYFAGMHKAASQIVNGTLEAMELVLSGQLEHAYHLAGGLHHAFESKAAGFCIYNDAVIAIKNCVDKYNLRVLYIDTDVHHGDGVQHAFYSDPNVCTYSIHETGKYLFPGTGFHYEKGIEQGYGTCFNIPMEPFTEDDSWLESFEQSITKVIEAFKPDIILSQHGCDAHAFDPLSHIHCSMKIYHKMPQIIHKLAHQFTGGKWVAIGGGGYDHYRVVPRAWSLVWLEMSEHPLVERLNFTNTFLPQAWLSYWSQRTHEALPTTWLDEDGEIEAIPRRQEITERNRLVTQIAIQDL